MRILYLTWLDPATTDYPLFLAREWEALGHAVRLFPYDLEFTHRCSDQLWFALVWQTPNGRQSQIEQSISDVCSDWKPDVLISGGVFLSPGAMERIRKRYAVCIGLVVGYNHVLEGFSARAISESDFLIVHDSYLMPVLKGQRYGKVRDVILMPSMAYPGEHRPIELTAYDMEQFGCDVAFIGGASANRVAALRRLRHLDLRIWGGMQWCDFPELAPCVRREPVYGLRKTKIYNAARIVLNIEDDEKQVNAFSQRVPEVLACGGFVLTERRADLDRTALRDGESVASFTTLDEMVRKVESYLTRAEDRAAVSRRGREIVLRAMTYAVGGRNIVDEIEQVVARRHGLRSLSKNQ